MVNNPPANAGHKKHWFDPWVGKIPWRRKGHPTTVFLPENPMDRAWQAIVNRVAKNQIHLSPVRSLNFLDNFMYGDNNNCLTSREHKDFDHI